MKLRAFNLIKSLGRGGAEVLLLETLKQFDRDRYELGYGYFVPRKDAMVEQLRAQGAEVTCFRRRSAAGILASSTRVSRFLRDRRTDLLHCHLPIAAVTGRIAGWLADVPVVYTEHNLQARYHPLTRLANRLTWGAQAHVIAVSREVAASISGVLGDGVPVTVVHNGIDPTRFGRESGAPVRRSFGIPASAPVVGTVAVFRSQKRLDRWLRAAGHLSGDRRDVHFLVVGDGPLRSEIESLAQRSGLAGRCHFTGHRQEARPCYGAMDVFMMSSDFEGLPVALLEAMASRLPVVATSVGGVPEVVVDGTTGYLVEPDDEEALVESCRRLVDSAELRRRLGEAGAARVSAEFSIHRMVQEIEHVYSEVLGHAA